MSLVQNLSKNETLRVYYKASGLETGLNVRFDFLRLSGSIIHLNVPADAEISGRGIYYYDFTAPNEDTYVVCNAYINDYVDLEPIIFKVGEPSQKCLFYYTEKTITGQLEYRIYNTNGVTVQEGDLTQVPSSNFWYVVFETPSEPSIDNNFFFEVDDTYAAHPFVAGVVSKLVDVFTISSFLSNPIISGEAIYSTSRQSRTLQVVSPGVYADALVVVAVFDTATSIITANAHIQSIATTVIPPTVSGDALVLVDVFDAVASSDTPDVPNAEIQSIATTVIPPTVSGDALVLVDVFENAANTPEAIIPVEIYSQPVNTTLIQPNITADATVVVSAFSVSVSLLDALAGDVVTAEKQPINITLLQPKINIADQVQQQPIRKGWPYDSRYSLGVASMPIGVVSGPSICYITVQFKLFGDNFPSEESIYKKKCGSRSSVRVKVDKIRRKAKKSNLKIRGDITKHKNDGPKIEFLNLEKV